MRKTGCLPQAEDAQLEWTGRLFWCYWYQQGDHQDWTGRWSLVNLRYDGKPMGELEVEGRSGTATILWGIKGIESTISASPIWMSAARFPTMYRMFTGMAKGSEST